MSVPYTILREFGYGADSACANIVLIYGNNGVLHYVDLDLANKVALSVGLTLKVDMVKSGQSVRFLGRVLIDS